MWCDLHGHDNELITVYGHVRIKNNGKVLSIKSLGISRAAKTTCKGIEYIELHLDTRLCTEYFLMKSESSWEQMIHFGNSSSVADIYWFNRIDPLFSTYFQSTNKYQ